MENDDMTFYETMLDSIIANLNRDNDESSDDSLLDLADLLNEAESES